MITLAELETTKKCLLRVLGNLAAVPIAMNRVVQRLRLEMKAWMNSRNM